MDKDQVADTLVRIATLLDLKGENPFKSRAYVNAARALETMSEPLDKVIAEGGLGEGAYLLPVGDQVGLMVKKGAVAFKVAVYQHGPIGPKEAAERTLAGKVVGRL